jgi:hypothetical protein
MSRPPQVMTLDLLRMRCRVCGECWEYLTDAVTEHHRRHPQIKHAGKMQLVRRVGYELARGHIKPTLRIVPFCGNPYCVNPAHQRGVTESQKGRMAAKRGAFSNPDRGRKIAEARRLTRAKLTPEQAQAIRESEESGPVLAERYGINKSRVNAIKRGDAWKDYRSPFAGLFAANDAARRKA